MKKIVSLTLLVFTLSFAYAQEPLPGFTLVEQNGRVVVSWTNPYNNLIQLNVQRSYDSLRNFVTIFSPEAPQLPQNGYTDNTPPSNRMFYRIFFVLEGGDYYFTKSKRAGSKASNDAVNRLQGAQSLANIDPEDRRNISITVRNVAFAQMPAYQFRNFRDSILKQTKDTLFAINDSLVNVNPYIAKEVWKPSRYVFVNTDGYIHLSLPRAEERKYEIKFFEENGTPLFETGRIRESILILDKSVFIHAGWFNFELYEDEKLKEKNKFYLPKDF